MIQTQCNRVYRNNQLATLSSTDSTENTFQPGRTLTLALGEWVSQVITSGTDAPLGCWFFLELVGCHDQRIIFVSAYQVSNQKFDVTTITATAQQTQILLQQGIPKLNPQQQFISNIILQIKQLVCSRKRNPCQHGHK